MAPTGRSEAPFLAPKGDRFLSSEMYLHSQGLREDDKIESAKWISIRTDSFLRAARDTTRGVVQNTTSSNTSTADPWALDGNTGHNFVIIAVILFIVGLMVTTIVVDCSRKRKTGELQEELGRYKSTLVTLWRGLRALFSKSFWKSAWGYLKKPFTRKSPVGSASTQKGKSVSSSSATSEAGGASNDGNPCTKPKESPFNDRGIAMRREISRMSRVEIEAECGKGETADAAHNISSMLVWHDSSSEKLGESSKPTLL